MENEIGTKRAEAAEELKAAFAELESGEGLTRFVGGHGIQSRVFEFAWSDPALEIDFRLPWGLALDEEEPRRARDAEKPATQDAPSADGSESAPTNAPAQTAERRHRRLAPEDLRARIDEAADLWRARVEIARTAAVDKLGLAGDKAQAFNDAVDAMNDKLRESMQLVADEIAAAKTMTPELGVRLMGDLSTSLAETYDAIGACVGEDLRGQVSDLQLVDFVDPSVAEPLIAVQDKIDPQSFRGPR